MMNLKFYASFEPYKNVTLRKKSYNIVGLKRHIFALRADFTYNIDDKIVGTVVANSIHKLIFLKNNK